MNDLQALLTFVFFGEPAPLEGQSTSRFHFFFDTDVVYTWLVGISDYLNSKKSRLNPESWLREPSLLISALLISSDFGLDLLNPHRWEVAQLLQSRGRVTNHGRSLKLLASDLVNSLPKGVEIRDNDEHAVISLLINDANISTQAIEIFFKLTRLALVNVEQQSRKMMDYYGSTARLKSARHVDSILNDPLYQFTYSRYEKLMPETGTRSKVLDCAAIVSLADTVAQFNSTNRSGPAPMFICGGEQTMFYLLTEAVKHEEFYNRLVILDQFGQRAFAFQTPLLLALESEADPNSRRSSTPVESQLQNLAGYKPILADSFAEDRENSNVSSEGAKAKAQWNLLTEATWSNFWILWLKKHYTGKDASTLNSDTQELIVSVNYDEDVLVRQSEEISKTILEATENGLGYITLVGWRREVGKVVDSLRYVHTRFNNREDLILVLRLFDLGFGRGSNSGLVTRLVELSSNDESYRDSLHKYVDNAWRQFQSTKQSLNRDLNCNQPELILDMAILLWFAETQEHRKLESRAIAALIREVVLTIPLQLRGNACYTFLEFRMELFDANNNLESKKQLDPHRLIELDQRLVEMWKRSVSFEDQLQAGFTAAYASFFTGVTLRSLISKGRIEHAPWPTLRLFGFCQTDYLQQALEILRVLRSRSEELNLDDEAVNGLIENQLLFFLSSGSDSLSDLEIREMHLLAGALRARRSAEKGWVWQFEDTLAIYGARIAWLMHEREDSDSEKNWLKRSRTKFMDAQNFFPTSPRIDDCLNAIEEALTLLR